MKATLIPPLALAASMLAACGMSFPSEPTSRADELPSAAKAAAATPACTGISGTFAELLTSPTSAAGTMAGDLNGSASIVITRLTESGQGARHFTAVHTLVTAIGDTLYTVDRGVMTPVAPPVYRISNQLTISRGTGVYAAASGRMHTTGSVDFGAGTVKLDYRGRLCR